MNHINFRRLQKNHNGRDFFATDIHGHFDLLERALSLVGFNPTNDRLFLGGDSVDRGPWSLMALDWLSRPYVHSVRGNHEYLCISSAEFGFSQLHYENGGDWFRKLDQATMDECASVFLELPIAIEVEGSSGLRIGMVHGECVYADWDLFVRGLCDDKNHFEQQHLAMVAMVRRTRHEKSDSSVIANVGRVFVGHSQANPAFILGNVHYMDSGAFRPEGALSLIDINSLEIVRCGLNSSPHKSNCAGTYSSPRMN
jgi:serine/threonine protein phosphatase 1